MASSMEFVQYAADQMRNAGEITYKKMFGEYGIYCDGKIIGLICDNQLFIKITEAGKKLCPDFEEEAPYEGSKPFLLVEDIDDRELLTELVVETFRELPMPAPKKKKTEKRAKQETVPGEKVDFKKRDKSLYQPGKKPSIVDVPEMTFFAVKGSGDPNTSEEYKEAVGALYALSYTIKMSKMGSQCPPGYFDYVVPPLEGLWLVDDQGFDGTNITDKSRFEWISMIRQPDFVTDEVFEEAKESCRRKKPEIDLSKVRLVKYTEGLCAQIMHIGPYDSEPETIERMECFTEENGYKTDISDKRPHHEIYLNDPRKTAPEKMKTVIRHPVRKRD